METRSKEAAAEYGSGQCFVYIRIFNGFLRELSPFPTLVECPCVATVP
jgi:hypothetical protein